jgi:two-component system osmolarity sensor histidine kinase EnvZ
MNKVTRVLNSLFGRLSLLTICLLLLIQITWAVVVAREQADLQATNVSRVITLITRIAKSDDQLFHSAASTLGMRIVNAASTHMSDCPDSCTPTHGPFENLLRTRLPPGSRVVFDASEDITWIRTPDAPAWLVLPTEIPGTTRLIGANATMLAFAIVLALIGAWQIQRPLLRLSQAARELRQGKRPEPLQASGPSEVRELTVDFNAMAQDISNADQERAVMLAGVAHDLRAPLTRIQVRASMLGYPKYQNGFMQDTESLSQIISQFLDLARDVELPTAASWQSVDMFCQTRYCDDDKTELLIKLALGAGPRFVLPPVELDRMLSNLIENAFSYGAPPLHISTERRARHYVLSVRDHGNGMPENDFERALRPFVRLDASRGGDARCGLGLTIVRRLARRCGGDLALSNAEGGGLCVSIAFPLSTVR